MLFRSLQRTVFVPGNSSGQNGIVAWLRPQIIPSQAINYPLTPMASRLIAPPSVRQLLVITNQSNYSPSMTRFTGRLPAEDSFLKKARDGFSRPKPSRTSNCSLTDITKHIRKLLYRYISMSYGFINFAFNQTIKLIFFCLFIS